MSAKVERTTMDPGASATIVVQLPLSGVTGGTLRASAGNVALKNVSSTPPKGLIASDRPVRPPCAAYNGRGPTKLTAAASARARNPLSPFGRNAPTGSAQSVGNCAPDGRGNTSLSPLLLVW